MKVKEELLVSTVSSPVGLLTLAFYRDRLCHIDFGTAEDTTAGLIHWAKRNGLPASVSDVSQAGEQAAEQLHDYFSGRRKTFDLDLLLIGTAFQKEVWKALAAIPYGETRTYKDVAVAVGRPKAIRAVGGANHRNPLPIVIPCHRVIGTNGALVGYGGGLDRKKRLLELEKPGKIKAVSSSLS
ncbi:methylated-DNA--[protein]-cysteine S-methyltransferase [Sporolactobacillus vineae]|uniref:methylated-DNA--[protein]-cysteine S-methyltransferase n=1 Tax=Sporolactobacillus vineae TaxID=444463 RepID=UPI000288B6AA|nr:methylated-DNA--[protein]-cysteine S-methyltransferase [Sporolactobacillus vineae]